ncbi:hypothetical protein G6L97_01240 [Agrobacterium tumefaciens]|uniref:hypothetical protein n=1 Tax=Agrobacterium TaxID=357 RepID=UPI000DD04472|nr:MULTISPECIES: hypothetical protein [Agrobacterium]NSY42204.1 hypothetical protein [Agrobacterium tumefaciens]NSZ83032.1 hypothetical protein [Agrobacterium tumefaciens]WCA69261.1 hypothetical protein G6L97_01240 [Agrobacterium tumefaciens]
MERPSDRLVTIATGYGMAETAVTCSFLRAYGIHTTVPSAHIVSVNWHLTVAFGGMEIRVPEWQRHEARLLLDSIDASHKVDEPSLRSWMGKIAAIVVFFFFSVPPPAKGLFKNPAF